MIHTVYSRLGGREGVRVVEQVDYDTDALTVTVTRDGESTTRPMTADEEVAAWYVARDAIQRANREVVCDPETIRQRIAALNAYLTDPQLLAYLDAANTTPLTVVQQNAVNKQLIRHVGRLTRLAVTLARLVDPSLLDDIADTAD